MLGKDENERPENRPNHYENIDAEISGKSAMAIGGDATVYNNTYDIRYYYTTPLSLESLPIIESQPPQVGGWQPRRLMQLIGRTEEKAFLRTLYESVRESRQGNTVILTGPFGSGRQALANDLRNYARNLGDAVELADLSETDPREFLSFVRKIGRKRPFLLVIDLLELEHSVWLDRLRLLAEEIQSKREPLPVLLLITLTLPKSLSELTKEQHTEPSRFSEKLLLEDFAKVLFLGSLSEETILESIAPADPLLAKRLHELTHGEAFWVEIIWQEWVDSNMVRQDTSGVWQAVKEEADTLTVFGDVASWAERYLETLLFSREDNKPLFNLKEVNTILNCAATEGEIFTTEAVAAVLKIDRDDVIDLFDDFLSPYSDSNDSTNDEIGIIEEVGAVQVDPFQPQRHVWEYRFVRPYFYYTWLRYPPREKERNRWEARLGAELELLYYPFVERIVQKLNILAPYLARSYIQLQKGRISLEELRHQVELIKAADLTDKYIVYRLFDLGFKLLRRVVKELPGDWQSGVELSQQLNELAKIWQDDECEIESYYYLVLNLINGGKYQNALPPAKRAAELSEQYKVKDSLIAASLSILGNLLQTMDDLTGARPYYERALAIRERVLGPEHPDTASSLNNLGYLLRATGDLAGARPYYERALAILERVLGPEHPDTAGKLNDLGGLLRAMGDLAGARLHYERALAIRERVLGPEHPHTATSLNNLGNLFLETGDMARAKSFKERALTIYEKVLGFNHPWTATSYWWWGIVLREEGQVQEAQDYFRRAYNIYERVLGPNHPNTKGVRSYLE